MKAIKKNVIFINENEQVSVEGWDRPERKGGKIGKCERYDDDERERKREPTIQIVSEAYIVEM